MIIIQIIGGLGNQMFQYAFGYAISRQYSKDIALDISHYSHDELRLFGLNSMLISLKIASKHQITDCKYNNESWWQSSIRKLRKQAKPLAISYYKEPSFRYTEEPLLKPTISYLEGYWQSEKYFKKYRSELLAQFSLKAPLSSYSTSFLEQIHDTCSVSMHIRRGDYISNSTTNQFHGSCPVEYYKRGLQHISLIEKHITIFIFSDDIEWTRDSFDFLPNKVFIELPSDTADVEEMYLMSQCKHNIIANSSFSWWGAWLNPNPSKIIVAPKKWFNDTTIDTSDLLPEEWIQL